VFPSYPCLLLWLVCSWLPPGVLRTLCNLSLHVWHSFSINEHRVYVAWSV
jgi:hypothetical protein